MRCPQCHTENRPIASFVRHVGRSWYWRALCVVSSMSLTIGSAAAAARH